MNTKNLETSTKKAWNVQIILKRAQKFQNFLLVSHSDYFVCFRILSIYATCFCISNPVVQVWGRSSDMTYRIFNTNLITLQKTLSVNITFTRTCFLRDEFSGKL